MFGKSKYYDAILGNLRRILGAPDATEAELDAQLSDMQDFSAVEQAAQSNVDAAIAAERDQLRAQADASAAEVNLLTTRTEEANRKLVDAQAKITELTTQLNAVEAERNTLAAKVADLQAGGDKTARVTDEGIATPIAKVNNDLSGYVVKTPELSERVLGKRKSA